MKCKNCGAHYSSAELRCPYCGTRNEKGFRWKRHREKAQTEYARTEAAVKEKLPLMVANRVANVLLVVCAVVLVGSLLASLIYFGAVVPIYRRVNKSNWEAQMQAFYEAGELGQLSEFMNERELSGTEYYAYTQATLLNFDYENMMKARAVLMQGYEQGQEQDAWELYYCASGILNAASSILSLDMPAYPELAPENAALYAEYCREAEALCRGLLGLTQEEVAALAGRGYCLTDEGTGTVEAIEADDYRWGRGAYVYEKTPLLQAVLEREAWK